jgi:hypothetical protein
LLFPGPLNLHPTVSGNLEMERDRPAADFARQPPDGGGVGAVEGIGNAENSREPFNELTIAEIE